MDSVIYQTSDLAGNKRLDFLEDARAGKARLRDKDGTSLVMLPESDLNVLEQFAWWSRLSQRLSLLTEQKREIAVVEFGELAWLRSFDRDDLLSFLDELQSALIAALADNDFAVLDQMVADWKITARQLDDPLRRSVLLGTHVTSDFEPAEIPRASNG